jgi:hypothetical protein
VASRRAHARKVGGQEALAEKGGVDAVSVVAFAYDTYTNPSKNNGVLRATLTPVPPAHPVILSKSLPSLHVNEKGAPKRPFLFS